MIAALPGTVLNVLERNDVDFALVRHPHTDSSQESAEAAHVSGEQLAKAVLLENDRHELLLAVLPATHVIQYLDLEGLTGSPVHPADEALLESCFPDCEPGAVPPFGAAYGLPTFVDQALFDRDTVYVEAGDHQSLIRLGAMEFRSLLFGAKSGSFTRHTH